MFRCAPAGRARRRFSRTVSERRIPRPSGIRHTPARTRRCVYPSHHTDVGLDEGVPTIDDNLGSRHER
jgi:hypothetical protein